MNTIIHMNHSPRYQRELEHETPPRERNASQLYQEMIETFGHEEADRIARSLSGYSYQEVCDTFIGALSNADARTKAH